MSIRVWIFVSFTRICKRCFEVLYPNPAQIHPNECIILSSFEELLSIFNKESPIRVFRQYYTLISSIKRGLSIP